MFVFSRTCQHVSRRGIDPSLSLRCTLASSARGKRRRPRKPLPSTKKDHLRSTYESKLPKSAEEVNAEQVTEQVEGRILQFRQVVRQAWKSSPFSAATTGGGSIASSILSRPQRVGPTMDGRWWAWNIALALLPATVICLYCEFIGKPEMEEYYANLEKAQQARILGTTQGEGEQPRIWLGETRTVSKDEATASTTGPPTRMEVPDKDEDSIAALKRRIELLEAQLNQDALRQRQQYQLQTMNHSGIQIRRDQQMVERWRTDAEKKSRASAAEDDEPTLSDKMAEAVQAGLLRNLEAKKDALKESIISIRDRLTNREEIQAESKPQDDERASVVDKGASESNDDVVIATEETAAAANRAAAIVHSSVTSSNDPRELTKAAKKAKAAASDAADAAQRASDAVARTGSPLLEPTNTSGVLQKTWNWLRRRDRNSKDTE